MVTSFLVPAGMGAATVIEPRPGRIPFGAIDRYARRLEIDGSAFYLMLDLISALDDAFLVFDDERARARAAARG